MDQGSNAPILLVEGDSVDEARTIRAYGETGHHNRLLVARSAENALMLLKACARGVKFGLVLLDMHLPGIGSKNLVKRIRGDRNIRDIPVVVMANCHESDDEVQSLAGDANTWIRRPHDPDRLADLLDQVVRFFLVGRRVPEPVQDGE